jgi:hypothetical protein
LSNLSVEPAARSCGAGAMRIAARRENHVLHPEAPRLLNAIGYAETSMDSPNHSGLGIASFIVSVAAGFLTFCCIVVAGVMAAKPGGMDETSPEAIIVGLLLFAFLFVSLVGLGLGIGGLVQKDRKKIFAVLGTIFSALTIAGTVFLFILGTMMG